MMEIKKGRKDTSSINNISGIIIDNVKVHHFSKSIASYNQFRK